VRAWLLLLCSLAIGEGVALGGSAPAPAIVPRPSSIELRDGTFVLRPHSVIVADRTAAAEARLLADALAPALGAPPRVVVTRHVTATRRRLRLCTRNAGRPCRTWIRFDRVSPRRARPEAYTLDVAPGVAVIRASEGAGWFYGAASLRQLLPAASFAALPASVELSAPCVRVADAPRFRWRGAMLDVARHFMPKATVLRLIDLIALHKLNRFHWHLTDDQGWRIAIDAYPRLTAVGSLRAGSPVRPLPHGDFLNFIVNGLFGLFPMEVDDVPHGGFYTQDDIREVVAYAAARHVTIVPEIDMPGHVTAAVAAYPELGNTGVPIPVATTVGIHEDILNVNDATFAFMETVLAELLALFPGEFVHVGGDEVPFVQWEQSAAAQQRMVELGLVEESQLATYFTNRIASFLTDRGRRVIAWNDVLRDGLTPTTAIMSWQGIEQGTAAARAGRDVVMAPFTETYFDHANAIPLPPDEQAILDAAPGARLAPLFVTTMEQAYAFEPVPSGLAADEAAHILGAQAQLWTEWMKDGREVERAAFPRMAAFAEVVWTAPELRDVADFTTRLASHLPRLEAMDVCYFGRSAPQCP
jgi:hexosaminidase